MSNRALASPLPRAAGQGSWSLRGVPLRVWNALPAAGRFALLGVAVSGLVAVALGVFIPLEIRRHLLIADGRGLEAAVTVLQPSLPDVRAGTFDPEEIAALDRLVDRTLLDADHVRAKLWSLEGRLLYSDAGAMIGRYFPDVIPRLRQVVARGTIADVTDLGDPENETERDYERLVEYYVPVRDEAGRTIAVFEIYEDVRFFEQALAAITSATWLAIGSGLAVLLVFLFMLSAVAVRSIDRDRAIAESRAAELTVLVDSAAALASSLEPSEFLARLDARVRGALGLSRFAIEPAAPPEPDLFRFRLRDGSWLVAGRADHALADEDARVLRSLANSVDAALANAALYAEVRDAAQARRILLRRVVEAHEDERRHLVGELHDSLAAELIRILYGVRGIASRPDQLPAEILREVGALEQLVSRAEADLRAFMGRVRPASLDEFGLLAALEATLGRFRSESGLGAQLRVTGDLRSAPPALQLLVLRAVEEALLNVRKHSGAGRVRVAVHADDRMIRLSVDDDGVGWPASRTAEDGRELGLAYLRERVAGFGGTLRTDRSRLGGARLSIDLPVDA